MAPGQFQPQASGVMRYECGDAQDAEEECLEPQGLVLLGELECLEREKEVVGQGDDPQVQGIDEKVAGGQHAQFKIPLQFADALFALATSPVPRDLLFEGRSMLVMSAR